MKDHKITFSGVKAFFIQFSFPLLVFVLTVPILWGWMYLVRQLLPVNTSPDPVLRPYMGVRPEAIPWLEVWQRWDVLHYQAIAERGYAAFDTSLFTPPLYPLLMSATSLVFGGNTLASGLLASISFYAASIIAFYRLAQFELKNEVHARRAVLYLVIFPTAFFLMTPYTESLFMVGSVMCLFYLRKKEWLLAGIFGAVAASARLTGAVLFLPALWSAWESWKEHKNWVGWLSPFLVGVAALVFPLYAWLGLGQSMMAPFEAQSQRFHGGFTFPGVNIVFALRETIAGNFPITNSLDIVATILFTGLIVPIWKYLPRVYGIYYAGFIALYLTRIADVYPLLSMARYVLALFPAFLILPRYGDSPITQRIIIYTSLLLSLFLSAQYAIWGWVG